MQMTSAALSRPTAVLAQYMARVVAHSVQDESSKRIPNVCSSLSSTKILFELDRAFQFFSFQIKRIESVVLSTKEEERRQGVRLLGREL
eukprot:scaffold11006_cov134-Amphora_coffeaeformis.AAC.1